MGKNDLNKLKLKVEKTKQKNIYRQKRGCRKPISWLTTFFLFFRVVFPVSFFTPPPHPQNSKEFSTAKNTCLKAMLFSSWQLLNVNVTTAVAQQAVCLFLGCGHSIFPLLVERHFLFFCAYRKFWEYAVKYRVHKRFLRPYTSAFHLKCIYQNLDSGFTNWNSRLGKI